MPKIQAVTNEMINRANQIGRGVDEILGSQNDVTRTFQNMGRDFSGNIPTLMTEHMLAMDSDYQEMNSILTQYKEFMEDAAHNYEWTDEELARWGTSIGL